MAKYKKHVDTNKDSPQQNAGGSAPELKYYQDQLPLVAELAEKSSRYRTKY